MPDIRQIALLMPERAGRFRGGRFLSDAKLKLRRAVAATAGTPLRHFYRAVYRAHVWCAVWVAKRFALTGSVYVSRSVARGEIAYGVSDIDMVVVGDWPEEEQIRLMRRLGVLTALSPLYDSGLWQHVHNRESLLHLWQTDYFFQSRFDEGRREWKLEYGTDALAALPAVPAERRGGGIYMELRSWWLHFIGSAFGSGPTAKDDIFRNSIAYKAVTHILEIAHVTGTGGDPELSRGRSLRASVERAGGADRNFLQRLERSGQRNHVSFEGDVQGEAVQLLLPALDRIHLQLGTTQSFAPAGEFRVDAEAGEILRTPGAMDLARKLIEQVKSRWPSYRAAYLTPSLASFAMDDLLLLIELEPGQLPGFEDLRELCNEHARLSSGTQRLVLYLLLPAGAVQVAFTSVTEMWRVLLSPASSPDLFMLVQRPEFLLDGTPAREFRLPVWSVFAYDLAVEEVNVRRSVLSMVTPDVFPGPLEILRNVWRHLQLEVVVRTADQGCARLPLSPAAVRRGLAYLNLSDDPLLSALEQAYQGELDGKPSAVRELIPQIIVYLKSFCARADEGALLPSGH